MRRLVYKENADALVRVADQGSTTPRSTTPHWVDDGRTCSHKGEDVDILRQEFKTGDRILKQRVQQLERQVAELTEQLSVFNRVAASCDAALQTAVAWISKK